MHSCSFLCKIKAIDAAEYGWPVVGARVSSASCLVGYIARLNERHFGDLQGKEGVGGLRSCRWQMCFFRRFQMAGRVR